MTRAMSIGPHDTFLLDQWGRQLAEAFGETPVLVGSAARAEPFRDVDVRMLGAWAHAKARPAKVRALNLSVTLWGRHVTGLPIDFQFQTRKAFEAEDGVRHTLGGRSRSGWRIGEQR